MMKCLNCGRSLIGEGSHCQNCRWIGEELRAGRLTHGLRILMREANDLLRQSTTRAAFPRVVDLTHLFPPRQP